MKMLRLSVQMQYFEKCYTAIYVSNWTENTVHLICSHAISHISVLHGLVERLIIVER